MFGFARKATAALKNAANYGGNKDFLEGVCAACALIAAADGNIEDSEVDAAVEVVSDNKTIQAAGYTSSQVETTLRPMLTKAKRSSGRLELKRELEDVIGRDETGAMREDILALAEDVASADGSVGPEEQKVLNDLRKILKI